MHVDDVVEAIFRQLCARQHCARRPAGGVEADMGFAELQFAIPGATAQEVKEAIRILRLSGDLFVTFTTQAWDRVAMGPSWRDRCQYETRTEMP